MKVTNKQKVASAAVAASMALAIPVAAFAGFTPANRPTFQCVTPSNCVGPNYPVFNSFTNAPNYGDERPFVDAKDAAITTNGGFSDKVQVRNGQIIKVRMYVHNNADPKLGQNGSTIARNVKVLLDLPKGQAKTSFDLLGAIAADNTNPRRIDDTVTLAGDRPFTVSYVPGSAKFEHRPDGVNFVTVPVSDSIVNGSASIGDIKACFEFAGFVTANVKVTMPEAPKPPVTPPTPVPPKTPPVTPPVAPPVTPEAPVQPLPETGAAGLVGLAGTGALGYAVVAYRRSKQALADKLLGRE